MPHPVSLWWILTGCRYAQSWHARWSVSYIGFIFTYPSGKKPIENFLKDSHSELANLISVPANWAFFFCHFVKMSLIYKSMISDQKFITFKKVKFNEYQHLVTAFSATCLPHSKEEQIIGILLFLFDIVLNKWQIHLYLYFWLLLMLNRKRWCSCLSLDFKI